MNGERFSDSAVLRSWTKNAAAWVEAVRERQIESRRAATDAAIVDAVLSRAPRSVLDIGCGEGWLARELANHRIRVTGVDAVPELVQTAQTAGGGHFLLMPYDRLSVATVGTAVDVAVANFSLLGKESTEAVFRAIPGLLNPSGAFMIQTLHPFFACGDMPYRDGWREATWQGFETDFAAPAPWYFRTMESWIGMFGENGLTVREVREPVHPQTRQPASVIFVVEPTH
ncbi:MAG TPA: class I SAM-dependent methyltransferase [Gammaproteobacteria bacterium]|nr:class I SAM-dependent methyltransferase [Gammaproteobacteria bacterium]